MGNQCCLVALPTAATTASSTVVSTDLYGGRRSKRKGSYAGDGSDCGSSAISVQSTWSSKDEPILPINKYFLTTYSPFTQTDIDALVRVFLDRTNNAVILTDAVSGLVIASAHAIDQTLCAFVISSPEGRVLTQVSVTRRKKSGGGDLFFAFDHYSRYTAFRTGRSCYSSSKKHSLSIHHNDRLVCQIDCSENNQKGGNCCLKEPIRRRRSLPGVDITAVLLFIAINQLID